MDIEIVKEKFDKLLKESKKDVNELKKDDKPYQFVRRLHWVDKNGYVVKLNERFKLLGYDRKPKFENPIIKGAGMLKEFLDEGHSLDELTIKSPIMRYINDSRILADDGHEMTLKEKFEAMGYPREEKRTKNVIEKIKQKIIEYVERTGNSVDMMGKNDPEYKYIWGTDIKDKDGKSLSIEEKFAVAGFDRKRKYSVNVKQDLIDAVNKYLAEGGSFHVVRNTLPFYSKLYIYCDHLANKNGFRSSYEDIMKSLGYREYSDLFYRYSYLKNLSSFRDEKGFVDSYKADKKMKAFVNDAAISLDVPIAVVVELICEEKLKEVCLSVDYFAHVKDEILEYVKTGKTLEGVSRANPELYGKISYLRKYISTNYGDNISSYDVLVILGLDNIDNNFKIYPSPVKEIETTMSKMIKIAAGQGGKIYKKDLSEEDYRSALIKSIRMGITTKALFKMYDIDYMDGRSCARLSKIITSQYPFMKEMVKRKQELIKESGVSAEKGACEEEIFEQNIKSGLQSYAEFKDKIFNYERKIIEHSTEKDAKTIE